METMTVDRNAAGDVVVRKAAEGTAAVERLRNEAAVLDCLKDVPGVPAARWAELVPGEPASLEIDHVGANDLTTAGALPLRAVVGLGARVATTLALVHDRQVVHGRIEASHVVLDRFGEPWVVGFGDATYGTERVDDAGRTASDDVAALGALLGSLLDTAASGSRSRPRPPGGRRARALEVEEGFRSRVGAIVAVAQHRQPERRPTMDMFADALAHERDSMAPPTGRTQPSTPDGAARKGRHLRVSTGPKRRGALAVAASTCCAIAAAVTVAVGTGRMSAATDPPGAPVTDRAADSPTAILVAPSTTSSQVVPAGSSPAPTAGTTPASTPPSTTPPSATGPSTSPPGGAMPAVSSSGAPSPSSSGGSTTIVRAGRSYELGAPGDVVTVIDPRCDGRELAVLLRPASGELFAFDDWATRTATVIGRPVGRFPGAIALGTAAGPACPQLVVRLVDGSEIEIPTKELW